MKYRTLEGETIDEIVWRVLGTTSNRVVETTYELNQNLAERGEALPAGVLVQLPEKTDLPQKARVALWN